MSLIFYSTISVIVPAPTVRPPSRMAKRALLERDGRHQLAADRRVITRHHHLDTFRQMERAGHIGGPDVELRTIPVEERRMTAAFFLRQDVHLALEFRMRLDGARLAQHLPALDIVFFDAAQQHADVVARFARIEDLPEHLDAGDDLLPVGLKPTISTSHRLSPVRAPHGR